MVPTSSGSSPCSIRTGAELRGAYLTYFQQHAQARATASGAQGLVKLPHTLVSSAPLIPPDDPTLMFTSAGMVQFKRLYSGEVDPLPYRRATTCQKCLRAGGKGSDLENVGKTLRHHTLFEMLGNFSFGDYFKREAIRFAWEFCTSPRWMGLPAEYFFATVYGPTANRPDIALDDEAERAWHEETQDLAARGLVPSALVNPVISLDEKENFWGPAGETGACGPCSEIKFFIGSPEELAEARDLARRDPNALGLRIIEEGDRFLEIWNMVFPQFDQQRDGSRPTLKNRGIDTGAGLERMTVALQWWHQGGRVRSPYETDLLWPIVTAVSEVTGIPYVRLADSTGDPEEMRSRHGLNAIADHIRALVFCLAEGITPSNDGRGYVVRRIQRRAIRFARLLGVSDPFLHKLVRAVVECPAWVDPQTGEYMYPEIPRHVDVIERTIRLEEERFLRTLDQGMKILDERIESARRESRPMLSGEDMFRLHATYGFPPDMTREIAEDAGLECDEEGYRAAMKEHQDEARKSWKGTAMGEQAELLDEIGREYGPTQFLGYIYDREDPDPAHPERRPTPEVETEVLAILSGTQRLGELCAATPEAVQAVLILEETNFHGESGGQVGDCGEIIVPGEADAAPPRARFIVADTQKSPNGLLLHRGTLSEGKITAGDVVRARPDWNRRWAIMRNHSVTHLLQGALRRVVGEHVRQSGSWVGPDTLRFDFTNMEAVGRERLDEIERLVNEQIAADWIIETAELPLEEARKRGAIAPFGEKYGHQVRVIQMGEWSLEFCGGTHLRRTGQAMRFRILDESSIAAGIRRIEAAAGLAAYPHEVADRHVLQAVTQRLQAAGMEAVERIEALQNRIRELDKEISKLKQSQGASQLDALVQAAHELPGGVRLVLGELPGMAPQELRTLADQARQKAGDDAVVLLATINDDKVALVCMAGPGAVGRYPANKAINAVAELVGGKGGGRPDMAQAGGKNPAELKNALLRAPERIAEMGRK